MMGDFPPLVVELDRASPFLLPFNPIANMFVHLCFEDSHPGQ